ncbi:hypothetical protein HDV00_005644 [Rhizophlyctis rosea]|nr:hypothetical protein HDV00_005644 [Rhizophlyctis rosea]
MTPHGYAVTGQINLKNPLESLPRSLLFTHLNQFFQTLKQNDGTDYKRASLRNCHAALARYLKERHPDQIDITDQKNRTPKDVATLLKIIEDKAKNLPVEVLDEDGEPAGPLTDTEVEMLFNSPALSKETPDGLQNRIMMYLAGLFRLNGQGHKDLVVWRFELRKDDNGYEYFLYHFPPGKKGGFCVKGVGVVGGGGGGWGGDGSLA